MTRNLVCAVLVLTASGCFSGYSETEPQRDALRVRRGELKREMVLSGELEAARGELLAVPPMPSWQTAIKWIAEDGAVVKPGDPVVELDNSALTTDLESKRQSAMQAAQELQQKEAEWTADLEQKILEVDKKKADLEKARIEAALPREIVSGRAFEEKANALRRAEVEHAKALDVLTARRTSIDAERRNLQLNIDKTSREIAKAERAIAELVLRAPKAGIIVVRDHPWEGRKFQAGDMVIVGFPLASIPDLSSIRVTAMLADVDDGKIAVGMPATVTLDGYSDVEFHGRVDAVSAVAQESRRASLRRNFQVLISLDKLDESRMRPGLSARVTVLRDAQKSVLLAPRAALDLSGKSPRARLENGELKEIKVGPCNAQDCVVTSGLEEGQRLGHA
jgi:multidrug resistance efflux pump